MRSTCPYAAFSDSQWFICGDTPSLYGPSPRGNVLRYGGNGFQRLPSSVTKCASAPASMSPSHKRVTMYDNPLASSATLGTTWITRITWHRPSRWLPRSVHDVQRRPLSIDDRHGHQSCLLAIWLSARQTLCWGAGIARRVTDSAEIATSALLAHRSEPRDEWAELRSQLREHD